MGSWKTWAGSFSKYKISNGRLSKGSLCDSGVVPSKTLGNTMTMARASGTADRYFMIGAPYGKFRYNKSLGNLIIDTKQFKCHRMIL